MGVTGVTNARGCVLSLKLDTSITYSSLSSRVFDTCSVIWESRIRDYFSRFLKRVLLSMPSGALTVIDPGLHLLCETSGSRMDEFHPGKNVTPPNLLQGGILFR